MPNINTALILVAGRGFQDNQAARTMGTGVIGTNGFAIIGGGYNNGSYIKDYYFGGGPFVTDPASSHVAFYATSATGSNMSASNFTFNAGRGRGTGTPGDIYFGTSTTGSTGDVLQTLSTRMTIKGHTGNVLVGSSSIDTNYKLTITGSGTLGSFNANNVLYVSGSNVLITGSTNVLKVEGSGSSLPLVTVQGSVGELFTVTDILSGSLFSVNDSSGLAALEVFSDSTVLIGSYLNPALHTTVRKTVNSGSGNLLYSTPTASYDAVWYDYSLRSGSAARVGQIMAMSSGSSVIRTETATSSSTLASTTAFALGVQISGSNMILSGSTSTSGWTFKTIIRSI
jgi:hypothetical protein